MDNNHAPNSVHYLQCAARIAKVMISEDGKSRSARLSLRMNFLGVAGTIT